MACSCFALSHQLARTLSKSTASFDIIWILRKSDPARLNIECAPSLTPYTIFNVHWVTQPAADYMHSIIVLKTAAHDVHFLCSRIFRVREFRVFIKAHDPGQNSSLLAFIQRLEGYPFGIPTLPLKLVYILMYRPFSGVLA